jgi:hypothetical protein
MGTVGSEGEKSGPVKRWFECDTPVELATFGNAIVESAHRAADDCVWCEGAPEVVTGGCVFIS